MHIMEILKRLFHGKQKITPNLNKSECSVSNFFVSAGQKYPDGIRSNDIFSALLSQIQDGCLVISDNMSEIPDSMLDSFIHGKKKDMNRLISIVIPGTVKRIGNRAFAGCENLQEVVLEEGIEIIEHNVFTGCQKLKTIRLPASVKEIDGWAFYDSGLIEPVFSADGKRLIYYPQEWRITEYSVPEGVEEIGSRSFIQAKLLTKISLPHSLKRICSMAFIKCGFTEIAVSKDILIETCAFANFDHVIEIKREYEDALEASMEYCRIQGAPFLHCRQMKLPQEKFWKEEAFQVLAQKCSVGNVNAMEQMGDYFFGKVANKGENTFYQCAAQFWYTRAYRYGSKAAKQYLLALCEKNPNSRLNSPGIDENLRGIASGVLLNALGFLFFEEDRVYNLSGVDKEGVIEVSAWESDDGPDEDGFGIEEFYDWWYLNEYLILPEGIGYIHSYSYSDKRCNKEKFLALHDQVAEVKLQNIDNFVKK